MQGMEVYPSRPSQQPLVPGGWCAPTTARRETRRRRLLAAWTAFRPNWDFRMGHARHASTVRVRESVRKAQTYSRGRSWAGPQRPQRAYTEATLCGPPKSSSKKRKKFKGQSKVLLGKNQEFKIDQASNRVVRARTRIIEFLLGTQQYD
jgi:hypothetical protein